MADDRESALWYCVNIERLAHITNNKSEHVFLAYPATFLGDVSVL